VSTEAAVFQSATLLRKGHAIGGTIVHEMAAEGAPNLVETYMLPKEVLVCLLVGPVWCNVHK